MKKLEFNLDGHEFIPLNALLKVMRLVNSGGEANWLIVEGKVLFNGQVELQKRKKIRAGDKVEFDNHLIQVN
ncbi:MAG: RNA-binding S4 domain-containing protein [Saprospiraceae bacterium]